MCRSRRWCGTWTPASAGCNRRSRWRRWCRRRFILIGSRVGDLIGRKRAYVLGLLGYAAGALAMTFAQSLTAIIIFWAVIGGLGASLLLPAMQSLIHGNFRGAAQKKVYAMVGAAAAIAAAVGPLLGGFITT